ncbi:pentatricopeptide repeat-containing protein [Prunus yedoensis var. nudiflora]|uniref:Pentatricopeptide repeat-containing protein n=1 Tax=Prunus yedoensis var. nudiflora TaxID=2094558 RepID=A0A314XHR4_PRUYE|nr:pentatricopeptide repeat-containing protein [Prunus yedoensis var. nudiflora]
MAFGMITPPFGLMVARLVSANQFRSAEALLDRMKEEKCSVTEDIFLSVCRAFTGHWMLSGCSTKWRTYSANQPRNLTLPYLALLLKKTS